MESGIPVRPRAAQTRSKTLPLSPLTLFWHNTKMSSCAYLSFLCRKTIPAMLVRKSRNQNIFSKQKPEDSYLFITKTQLVMNGPYTLESALVFKCDTKWTGCQKGPPVAEPALCAPFSIGTEAFSAYAFKIFAPWRILKDWLCIGFEQNNRGSLLFG